MRLMVLGSGGAELPGFNAPGFLIDGTLLLDAGTIGAALEMEGQWKIRDILLTHAHLDHIKGIPFLADNIMTMNKKHTVTVMGIAPVLKALKKNLLNNMVWPDFTAIPDAGNPVLRLKSIRPGRRFDLNGYSAVAQTVNHSVPATGYVIEDAHGKRLLYTGDTGPTEAIWKEGARRIHCAIIEVSLPNRMRRMAVMTGHLTPHLLREEIKKMENLPDRILITHPKPQYLKAIKEELGELLMPGVRMLREGEEFRI